MKRIYQITQILIITSLLSACVGSSQPYAYDDVYYSPSNDPVRKVQKDPREDFNKTDDLGYESYPNRYNESYSNEGYSSDGYAQDSYNNSYSEAEQAENAESASGNKQTVIINNSSDGDVDYYDPEYARSVERLNQPIQSFNTYDPYMRDRILYTNDPYFYQPNIYGRYSFYDPFMPSTGLRIGWNSWSGWNVGVGIGFGYSSWASYDPFWNPWRPTWGYNPMNPWAPSYGWGFGYGWGYDPYWAGYNQGYYNGYYAGNHYVGGGEGSGGRGRTRITTPRGSSGSRSFAASDREANRPGQSNRNARVASDNPQNQRQASPNSGRDDLRERNRSESRPSTPERYATDRSRESYTRPSTNRPKEEVRSREQARPQAGERSNQPTNTVPTRRPQTTRPATNTPQRTQPSSRPRTESRQYNSNYNSNRPVRPQRSPNYQSRPSNNNYSRPSRPSYNRTPSYTPSRSSGGGSRPSRGSTPSRSSSRPRR